jgi:hypothetical protein
LLPRTKRIPRRTFGPSALRGTIRGAPSDRVLTREIKAAEIVRIPLSPTLRSGKADVFGADSGVGYPAAEALPGARIVPGAFAMVAVAHREPTKPAIGEVHLSPR